MANQDFKKILINEAYIQWPKLDQCYRYDRMKKEWQRVDQNAQGAAWHCGVLLSAEEAMKLGMELKAHYNECRTRNPNLPAYGKIFGLVKNDDGTMIFNGKKNGVNRQGQPNKEPTVLAGDLTPLADRRIWSGSMGNVRFSAYPSQNPDGEGGISLLIDTIQVTKAVYGSGDDADDFKPVTMQTEQRQMPDDDDRDEFGLPPIDKTPANEPPKASGDFDDEIPF